MVGGQVPLHGDHAAENRVQVGDRQVGPYPAAALRAFQKPAERIRQRRRGLGALDADAGSAEGAGEGDVLLRLGGEFPDEGQEGRGRVGRVARASARAARPASRSVTTAAIRDSLVGKWR
jgi:hypothetical protein